MATASTFRRQPRVFYGWYIVMAHIAVHFYMAVSFTYGTSVFLNPIVAETGWTRAQFSLAGGLQRMQWSGVAPLVGLLVDRIGSRKVVIVGAFLVVGGFLLVSRVETLVMFYGAYLVLGAGWACIVGIPFTAAAANWFRRKRGRAMGMIFLGGTFSGLFLPLVVLAINQWGWRTTMRLLGLGFLAVGLPAVMVVRSRPEPYGYLPDGESSSEPVGTDISGTASVSSRYGLSVRQVIRTPSFWLLTLIFGLLNMGPGAMFLHQVPYFESVGFSATQAASTIAAFTLLSGIGRIGGGWLMDYVDRRIMLAGMVVLSILGFMVLLNVTQYWHSVVYALLFGLSFGASIPAQPIFISQYYGTRAFGAITGLTQSLTVVGGITAPVLMGWVYDTTGTYDRAIIILAAVISLAIPLALFLPKPRPI